MLRDASQRASAGEAPALASRCDAPQHEGEGDAHFGETNPTGILAKRTQRAFWPTEPRRGACARAKYQPAAVRNERRRSFIVSGLLFTMRFATHTCRPH